MWVGLPIAPTLSAPAQQARIRAEAVHRASLTARDLGRPEAAAEEAVAIRRELAAARPDAFRPDLAMAPSNQSNHLSDLGRREEALAAAEEAAATYRDLAAARPYVFGDRLAASLSCCRRSGATRGQSRRVRKRQPTAPDYEELSCRSAADRLQGPPDAPSRRCRRLA